MTRYLANASRQTRALLREVLKDVRPIDYICICIALAAVGYMIHGPAYFASYGETVIGPRTLYQSFRGVIIALGIMILIDRRANSKAIKVAVTFVIVGLSMNIARNANPTGLPLTLSYATANMGVFIWFMSILFRMPWRERYEIMKKLAEHYKAQLSKYEKV